MFKILVATDGSKYAYNAADYAGFLARMIEDAEITVLSVIDAGAIARAAGHPPALPAALSEEMERAAWGVLEDTRCKLSWTGKEVAVRLERGIPASIICDVADKGKFDLVVMGSRGHGPIAGILLGSVSDKVLHKARVPVLIVRAKRERER